MAEEAAIEQLNASVMKCMEFVTNTKAIFKEDLKNHGPATSSWLREIEQIEQKQKLAKVIIGVVGATGSGKSSLINAILGETQLVPTNCMRACTAVVTEISYNNGDSAYRAVIEFVSSAQWQDELKLIIGDIVPDGKITDDIDDDDSAAGIAFAKVQAVYPHLNKKNLSTATVDDLMQCENIKNLVGNEIEFSTSTAEELYDKIQRYVDSKEKLAEDFMLQGMQASSALDDIAYWPLIRTVRIYTKSPILKTGSVLVDLPGIADSNAARAAIAQKYLQKCAALWIVAPIIRAVDDKSARYLLNDGFKRQLWRDGTLQKLTFICSKVDEISVAEARSSLQRYPSLKQEFLTIDEESEKAIGERVTLDTSLLDIMTVLELNKKLRKEAIEEEKAYKALRARAIDGESVYPLVRVEVSKRLAGEEDLDVPCTPAKKTKSSSTAMSPSDLGLSSPASVDTPTSRSLTQVQFREDSTKPRLTLQAVKTKRDQLKLTKAKLKEEAANAKEVELKLHDEVRANKDRRADIGVREWNACVSGRNEVSSHAIRADFAAGLKDMVKTEHSAEDTDDMLEDNESGNEAGETARLESTNSTELPVFCVSAKGFYKASGQMRTEKIAACFKNIGDTGVPALQKHVCQLGNDAMVAGLQTYVDASRCLLTSLRLWSSGGAVSNQATKGASMSNEEFCFELIKKVIAAILQVGSSVMDDVVGVIDADIFSTLPVASKSACVAAVPIATQWSAPVKPKNPNDIPGLYYSTFKAVVRRTGTFTQPRKVHDFNGDLLQPYMEKIDARWGQAFNSHVDRLFQKALRSSASELDKFVEPFAVRLDGSSDDKHHSPRETFEQQMKLFTKSLGTAFRKARQTIDQGQKEANRLFAEAMKTQMKCIYLELEGIEGRKAYIRAKDMMRDYLEQNKISIFDRVSQRVKEELETMLEDARKGLLEDLNMRCDYLQRDCRNLCQKNRDFKALPQKARKAIIKLLLDAKLDKDSLAVTKTSARECGSSGMDVDHGQPMSMQSMTPVLMTSSDEQICTINEEESESDSSDDDSEDED